MTMAPGTQVSIQIASTPSSVPSALGTFFVVGQAAIGPVGVAVPVTSLTQYVNTFGGRNANATSQTLYDAVDAFFQEGGQLAYVSRVFAAASISTSVAKTTLNDQATGTALPTLQVAAQGPGVLGNQIQVAVTASGSSFTLTITCPGYPTEASPPLISPQAAVAWADTFSSLVTITDQASTSTPPANNPKTVAATSLTGGSDGAAPAASDWTTALTEFTSDLGIGQVAAPGQTTLPIWTPLLNHAAMLNRYALLDAPDNPLASGLQGSAASAQGSVTDPSFGFMLAPWTIYPGLPTSVQVPPPDRHIAPSGPVAGAMARLAGAGNNGDAAAAGPNGQLVHASGVTQTYVDSDRALLDQSGVGVIRNYRGAIMLYGYTGLSLDPNWADVGNARLRMQIIDSVRQIGDSFIFADLDEAGHTLSAFGGMIAEFLTVLYNQNALFGASPSDAFFVNVGDSINTPQTASAREMLADISVRMSPTAEYVLIAVTKVPVAQTLPS